MMKAALKNMVSMFERVGLQTNLGNTKAMICMPGFIWGKYGAEAYKLQASGEGPTFRERKRTRVSCEVWGGTMAASSLQHHIARQHGRVFPQVRGVDFGVGVQELYKLSVPQILKLVDCPVEGCPA